MKEYPKIAGSDQAPELPCVAFMKYDGQNFRAEWNRKSGWCKFGSRRVLVNESSPEFGPAIKLFQEEWADNLEKVVNKMMPKWSLNATVFLEYYGPFSFAGNHDPETLNKMGFTVESNEPMKLRLIDVSIHKRGFLNPYEFRAKFGHLDIAETLYEGILTQEFLNDVREGNDNVRKYYRDQAIFEGVVCKGGDGHDLWMCKIKTNHYKKLLQERMPLMWQEYWE